MNTKRKGPPQPANRRSYGIAFDTKSKPGKVLMTKVTLEQVEVHPDDVIHVNLSEDAHYKELVHYIMNNMAQQGTAS